MISSYLKRPLRTLEQALEGRAQPRAPGTVTAQPADPPTDPPANPDVTGPGSIELLVRLLTENTDHQGALDQQPLIDRRRAA